ncbi:MAG: LacI family DNA-binding transcriptional regulator [Anaerolineae bacterium]|nr:LacI family DNA-binding transcriptional regulator [Anaerolineae bacterium]
MSSKATLKDVARRAGVSYQTVSKVLRNQMRVSPEVRERIYAAVEELGYRPNVIARNLRAKSSHLIGYSWQPDRQGYFNPILEEFEQSIVCAAEEYGYHILLFPQGEGAEQEETYRDLVITGRVDGFILSGIEYNDPRIPILQKLQVPLVAFGRTQSEPPSAYVDVDGGIGVQQAVEHLLAQGHRRIAALAWPEYSRVGNERLAGYFQAMATAGLPVDPAWIVRGESDYNFGYMAMQQFLALPPAQRPTAVVTMLDLIAIGAMRAIEERGMTVGRDIAVIGFDDTPVARYLKPALTSISQPAWEVGQHVVRLLVSQLSGETTGCQQLLLPSKLVIRESSLGYQPAEQERAHV